MGLISVDSSLLTFFLTHLSVEESAGLAGLCGYSSSDSQDWATCNTLQHSVAQCNTLQHAATRCNTLQHAATHHNNTATHCNTLGPCGYSADDSQDWATCNTLQHTATRCNTLQHTATHCTTLQHAATHCNTLQFTATTLQHTATRLVYVGTFPTTLRIKLHVIHCNTLQHTRHTAPLGRCGYSSDHSQGWVICVCVCVCLCVHADSCKQYAKHCNTLQHNWTEWVLSRRVSKSSCMQHTAIHVHADGRQ